jgi:polyhydroxyalkanoate synthesis regulator phasin
MSVEQAKEFTEGLKTLGQSFREDCKATTAKFEQETKDAAKQFQVASHEYAKAMTSKADAFIHEIQALYKDVYSDDSLPTQHT